MVMPGFNHLGTILYFHCLFNSFFVYHTSIMLDLKCHCGNKFMLSTKRERGSSTRFWPIYKDDHLYTKKISFLNN